MLQAESRTLQDQEELQRAWSLGQRAWGLEHVPKNSKPETRNPKPFNFFYTEGRVSELLCG